MKHSLRLVAAVLSVQALTATVAATAAYAHPGHGQQQTAGHTPGTHGNAGNPGSSAMELRALARLDSRLGRATKDSRVGRLSDADAAALLVNAAADTSTVETVAADLTADPSDTNLAAAEAVLGSYAVKPYVLGVNLLRHSERVAADIATLQATAPAGSDEAAALASAATLLAGVPASGFSATTDATTLRADQHAVAQAQALVGQVADALAGA